MNRAIAIAVACASLAACALAGAASGPFSPRPSANDVHEAVQTVLSRPYYDLERNTEGVINLGALLRKILRPIQEALQAFTEAPAILRTAVLAALIITLVAILAHIAYVMLTLFQRASAPDFTASVTAAPDPAALEREAESMAGKGDFAGASRALYRAALVSLENHRGGRFRQGLTNTEYLRTFKSAWVIQALTVFTDLLNWKWYRDRSFDLGDYHACRSAYESIRAGLARET